jgi:ligand-binding SRPBCC domain-containing protein
MTLWTLRQRQLVRRPVSEVFAFFSRPENLERLTPKTLGFRILTPSPIAMKEGAVIDYAIRIVGVPVRWTTLIALYEPPHRFIDIQQKGPYASWHHTHTFAETPDGTLITDEVRYAMPYGLLGRIAHTLFVARQLAYIFRERSYTIEEIFDTRKEHLP